MIIAPRHHEGVSVPLILVSIVAHQHLCDTFHHLNPIEGFWRVMKNAIGAGRCFSTLQQLYWRTRQVLMAHHERPIYEFHW
jgi:hypothetical protein